jgi:hypothetical protein
VIDRRLIREDPSACAGLSRRRSTVDVEQLLSALDREHYQPPAIRNSSTSATSPSEEIGKRKQGEDIAPLHGP